MSAVFPDWPQKMQALQELVHWAAGGRTTVAFRDSVAGGRLREAGEPWIMLALNSISEVGEDQVLQELQPDGSRLEVYTGQRNFVVELRARARSQEHVQSAWYLADRVRTRVRKSSYARQKWLTPNDIGIVTLAQVVNLPRIWDLRTEGEAVLEMNLTTKVTDRSAENQGEWIERVLLSGAFGADPGLDFVDVTIPAP